MAKKNLISALPAPAYLAFLAYLAVIVLILLPINLQVWDSERQMYVTLRYRVGERLMLAILVALPAALSIYNVSCTVTGNCNAWAWILAVIALIYCTLFVLSNLLMAVRR